MQKLQKKQRSAFKNVFPNSFHLLQVKVRRFLNQNVTSNSHEFTASDRCQQEKRKTINGEDILWAMQSLGFENYTEALKIYLGKYREVSYPIEILFNANANCVIC